MKPSGAQIGAVAGIAALAIVVGVLSAVALQQGRGERPEGTPSAPPTFEFGGSETSSPTPTDTSAIPTVSAADERFLAIQGDRLWRATSGTCGGEAPVVELSTDRGESWNDVTPTGAAQILATAGLADVAGEVVAGLGDSCEPEVLRTYTAGVEWNTYPDALTDMTYLSPADGKTVVRPGDDVAAPCDNPLSVRASRGVVGLVCDGTAYALLDERWTSLTHDAITVDAVAGTIVVAHSSEDCDGVAVSRFTGTTNNVLTCFSGANPADSAAVSMLSGELALWSGDRVFYL